jgi:peroxiredoxin
MIALQRLWVSIFLALMLGQVCAAEQPWVAPGPKTGEVFPDPLNAPDQTGRQRSLDNLMGEKGVAVFFVRSADWCPFCRKQLAEVNARREDFGRLGFSVVSVSVDTVELVKKFHDAGNIQFPMLADPKGAITSALSIRDPNYPEGHDAYGVPQPGIFVIDRQRRIVGKYFEQGYRTRPDLDRVLADLARL